MSRKFYQGRFKPKNPNKYRGDTSSITFRSSWEAATFFWLDKNEDVIAWSSEEIVVPYVCPVDGRVHRYYVDLWMETPKGTYIVEIKPQKECLPPTGTRKTQKLMAETATFARNQAKWLAADAYARSLGYKFYVWDEVTLKKLGVVI